MKKAPAIALKSYFFTIVAVFGCGLFDSELQGEKPGTANTVGDPCKTDDDCRENLVCGKKKVCQPCECKKKGQECQLTEDCADNLFCNRQRVCVSAGDAAAGQLCQSTADCKKGLTCSIVGVSTVCAQSGESDLSESCETTGECLAGLSCVDTAEITEQSDEKARLRCASVETPLDLALPPSWRGIECEADQGPPKAYFEIPRNDREPVDFYRLPFPNDIRRDSSGIDLGGHPVAPETFGPLLERLVEATARDVRGFATNPVIIFRFSEYFLQDDETSIGENVQIVDITPGSPSYNQKHSRHWASSEGRTKYLCPNWFAVATGVGEPLRPLTTYAAYLTTAIKSKDGTPYERSSDFNALLSETPPSDGDLESAYQAYEPFRAWLADSEIDPDTILNAAVFTTQDPHALLPELRNAVHALELPAVSQLTRCGDGVTSPCADESGKRGCGETGADFIELHGRIALPIFQRGTAPYLEPQDGGELELDQAGVPRVARTEAVCFALTLPVAEPPESGYPLMIYAHGTGGSFTAAVENGFAAELAAGEVDGIAVPGASLSIDLPQHGERRGGSERSAAELFFNLVNPRAARDNVLQGAADLFALVRWAKGFALAAGDSPTDEAISFNPSRIVLWGHSQGATHASLMLPYEPDIAAAVLSGHGGHLTTSLLTKTSPINISAALPYALSDANDEGELHGGALHPMLAIVQTLFERVDPVNFAYRLREAAQSEAVSYHHLFMVYGLRDSYSPAQTQRAYAVSGRMTLVAPEIEELKSSRIERAEPPLLENVVFEGARRTIGLRQYQASADGDGHFVATEVEAARSDVKRFILQAMAGQSPQIGSNP
ncbi:MAG: hypothetical protein JXA30_10475 [Deltaproteobacteria bacterium]|nr:hypothetical protein [Deltaproteobacteria bacterium]